MKKLFALLVAVGCFTTVQAKADLVSAATEAQKQIDSATATVENTKAAVYDAQTEATKKVEAKKQEVKDKVVAEKAKADAKKAEQKKAVEDTKNSLNNLKNAFTK